MRISDWSSDVCSSDLISTRTSELHAVFGADVLVLMAEILVRLAETQGGVAAFQERDVVAAAQVAIAALHDVDGEAGHVALAHGLDVAGELARDRVALAAGGEQDAQRVGHLLHRRRSEEHTSELQSLMRISYAVFCL